MNKWLKEPLLHFLLLGALIFVVNDQLNGSSIIDEDEIVVSLARQENLANTFARTWQRPPTKTELDSLIIDFIRQEIAYRESQSMQLDRDDIVIRRRMRQKLEMLAEDVASMTPPQEGDLRQYFEANAESFRRPAVLSFRQVYFNADGDPAESETRAEKLLADFQRDESSVDFAAAGDPSMLPRDLKSVRVAELGSVFGTEFADALQGIEVDTWNGPVRSGFGIHLVKIDNRIESQMPSFDEVSELVQREWLVVQRTKTIDGMYERMAEKYSIVIEASPAILPDAIGEAAP